MSDLDMQVDLGGIRMKNPVTVASGTFGYGKEYAELIDVTRLGAITVKGIRLQPWPGNRLPRHVEVPGGMVNAIGLQGPGVEGFARDYMPFLRTTGVPVIVNIWGTSEEEYAEVARRLSEVEGVSGLELNISCPNVKEGGHAFGTDPQTVASLVAAVRRATRLPLMPKLAPNVPDIRLFVRAAQEAGADALALINTLPAMVIDIETRRPVLANKVGGLSGLAIHPVAVKLVWEAAQAARVPLLAMGGIVGPEQAIEFLVAGASAVAVGTANFIDPTTPLRVLEGIEAYLRRHGMNTVAALTGSLRTE
ncbi:MAG TPA: dihydroorotate dehydrogenase [Kiritimatiellia bacterium]|nr:MAG: Dihydroorotate dehydrogenase B (NAD(+)), catalytic subunit [Verrucomicrobia bacterium ADurb.Bin070]HQQ92323.1 dihydroorotate dehydrogenase [Kiritimatiellia bacterium]